MNGKSTVYSRLPSKTGRSIHNLCIPLYRPYQQTNTKLVTVVEPYPSEKYESVGVTIPNIWKNTCSKPPISNYETLYIMGLLGDKASAGAGFLPFTVTWKCTVYNITVYYSVMKDDHI